jgi:hypothetical protein
MNKGWSQYEKWAILNKRIAHSIQGGLGRSSRGMEGGMTLYDLTPDKETIN